MKHNYKLSVIIPLYNMELYIGECLESVFCQNISENEYEVIVIDDCSTDNSVSIVEFYKNKYANIKLIKHDVNKKQGGARNTGLSNAKGDYVLFIDADDYFEKNVLRDLIYECEAFDLDLLIFDFYYIKNDKIYIKSSFLRNENVLEGKDFLIEDGLLVTGLTSNVWTKMYKASFLRKHRIIFEENIFFEDVDFALKSLFHAKKSKLICKPIVNNRYNLDSTTSILNAQRLFQKILLYNRLFNFAKITKNNNIIYNNIKKTAIKKTEWCIMRSFFLPLKEKRIFGNYLCKFPKNNLIKTSRLFYKIIFCNYNLINLLLYPAHPFMRIFYIIIKNKIFR